jgi:hypothetical protein
MKGEEQQRWQMVGRDRDQRWERNKGSKHVVLYLLGPLCGSHPKQGCGRVECEDLEKKKERGKC